MDRDGGNEVDFKLYGVTFDAKLVMTNMVALLRNRMNAKLLALFQVRRYYSVKQMFSMYKSQMLGTVEWCTAGIFHCTKTLLHEIDGIQSRFLTFMGVLVYDAYIEFNLAPLELRRKIAMLGFIFRCG